ncbi:hypothetical protein F5144DRAFT_396662 [Chaetomium tenue]|uniref:Uncharacterized protein n=1 Tax=Chaetomium tenue TaxID=1854479 RepID=A0ACB7NWG6_9PEZI|nr:hypothetical protein F5144DRAFT_396662 [Chaetomium globosum]
MQTSSNEATNSNTSNTSNNKSQSENSNPCRCVKNPDKPPPALVRWIAEKPGDQPFSGLTGVTVVKGNPGHGEASPLDVDLGPGPSCDLGGDKRE